MTETLPDADEYWLQQTVAFVSEYWYSICKPCFLYFCSDCSFGILLRHHLEAWKIFEETINKSSSVDWHPSPKPKPGSGGGGLGKMIQRKSKKSVWLLLFTFFHMSIDVSRCFPTFPTFRSLQELSDSQPKLKSSSVAFAGAGTVITILVVLAWPQESQAIPSHNLLVANFWTWET